MGCKPRPRRYNNYFRTDVLEDARSYHAEEGGWLIRDSRTSTYYVFPDHQDAVSFVSRRRSRWSRLDVHQVMDALDERKRWEIDLQRLPPQRPRYVFTIVDLLDVPLEAE